MKRALVGSKMWYKSGIPTEDFLDRRKICTPVKTAGLYKERKKFY